MVLRCNRPRPRVRSQFGSDAFGSTGPISVLLPAFRSWAHHIRCRYHTGTCGLRVSSMLVGLPATPRVASLERPTRRGPAVGRLRPLSLRRVRGAVVRGTVSAIDHGTELNSHGNPVAPEPVSVRGEGAGPPCTGAPSGPVTLAASRPFSPTTTLNSAASPSPALYLVLCGLLRTVAVRWMKISSRVSLRLMHPYPFFTLNH